jgi:hypothetical protein
MIELRATCGWKAHVHKSLLCHYSTYYKAAIYGQFHEATHNHFDLGLNKNCTEWFVRWLYSGEFGNGDPCPDTKDLVRLYVFADEKDILGLRRAVMTRLTQMDPEFWSYCSIALAINSLPPSATLYKFIVEWYTNHWYYSESENSPEECKVLPKEFFHLVMSELASRANRLPRSGTKPSCACCGRPCHWHAHDSHDEWLECEFQYPISSRSFTHLFRKLACGSLDEVKHYDCPEELIPKQPEQSST